MNQEKVGRYIAQKRKEHCWTQTQLGEKIGVTNKAVSKWETGRGFPDASLLKPLADALDVSMNELFSGEDLTGESANNIGEEKVIELIKIIDGLKKEKQLILYFVIALMFLNLGHELPNLLVFDSIQYPSDFYLGFVDGVSVGLILIGVVYLGLTIRMIIARKQFKS